MDGLILVNAYIIQQAMEFVVGSEKVHSLPSTMASKLLLVENSDLPFLSALAPPAVWTATVFRRKIVWWECVKRMDLAALTRLVAAWTVSFNSSSTRTTTRPRRLGSSGINVTVTRWPHRVDRMKICSHNIHTAFLSKVRDIP